MIVLKEFTIDENAQTFLRIKGRQEGIMSWIFSKIGIDPTVEMACNKQEVLFKESSIRKGQLNVSIPNTAVTAVVTGYHKPFRMLVLAAMFILGGIIIGRESAMLIMLGLIFGGACLVYYVLNKAMLFCVFNGGDTAIAYLKIKRSVIEGVALDFEKFEKAAALLNKAVLESSAGGP